MISVFFSVFFVLSCPFLHREVFTKYLHGFKFVQFENTKTIRADYILLSFNFAHHTPVRIQILRKFKYE